MRIQELHRDVAGKFQDRVDHPGKTSLLGNQKECEPSNEHFIFPTWERQVQKFDRTVLSLRISELTSQLTKVNSPMQYFSRVFIASLECPLSRKADVAS